MKTNWESNCLKKEFISGFQIAGWDTLVAFVRSSYAGTNWKVLTLLDSTLFELGDVVCASMLVNLWTMRKLRRTHIVLSVWTNRSPPSQRVLVGREELRLRFCLLVFPCFKVWESGETVGDVWTMLLSRRVVSNWGARSFVNAFVRSYVRELRSTVGADNVTHARFSDTLWWAELFDVFGCFHGFEV